MPTEGLVGYWSFNEGSGKTAFDGSGNNLNGALTYGPVWTPGSQCVVGSCLSFDGGNDYVKILDSPLLKINGDITISAWINPVATGSLQTPVSKRTEFQMGSIQTTAPYAMNWSQRQTNGATINGPLTGSTDFNTWQHVVLVRKGATKTIIGYKNAATQSTSTYAQTPNISTYALTIGRRASGGEQFKGLIDEVRIYNRVLSPVEISELYAQGQPSPDSQPPTSPTDLSANAISANQVNLSWSTSTDDRGVAGYKIYRDGTQIATSATTTYQDSGLSAGRTYNYRVSAYDAAGNESAQSAVASATTPAPDTEAPSVPANLTATAFSSTQIQLAWDASTDNSSVTGYKIYRGGTQIATSSTNSFIDSNLLPATAYSYNVSAYDAAGNQSPQSAAASATTLEGQMTIEARVNLGTDDAEESSGGTMYLDSSDLEMVRDSSDQRIGLRFNNLNIPRGATITNAYIQFATDEATSDATVLTIAGEATDNSTTFSSAAGNVSSRPRTNYNVQWQPPAWSTVTEAGTNQRTSNIAGVLQEIVNRPGWSAQNSLSLIITGSGKRVAYAFEGSSSRAPLLHVEYGSGGQSGDTTSPTTPTNLRTNYATSTQASFSWDQSFDNVGVAGYKVYRNGAEVGTTTLTSFLDTGLSSGTSYSYTVSAYDAAANQSPQSTPLVITTLPPGEGFRQTIVGAGDIAGTYDRDELTAQLIDQIVAADPNTIVYTLGDNAYNLGSPTEYQDYYHPTWGRHRSRTLPAVGNHEYGTPGASGYLNYFCPTAADCVFPGDTQQLYYSYNIGPWHLISLDSEQDISSPDTPMMSWLRQDLAADSRACTLAYWHVPRFGSSSSRGNQEYIKPLWDVLYADRADVVINGHDHHYERFDLQDPAGNRDLVNGMREFIAGTGGYGLYDFQSPSPNSLVRQKSHGVLKLVLYDNSYEWEFIGIDGFRDAGTGSCNP